MKPLKKLLCYLTEYKKECVLGPLFKLLCAAAVVLALTVGATVFFRVDCGGLGQQPLHPGGGGGGLRH